tara:strand:+ start:379 stop:1068 length:690 start_codon:yes stop_codon:yes gene_type:complete
MESRKVTEQEAKDLMAFCKKKDVYYIDLRLELVDHLAHSIEEHWVENPKATFSEALQVVYKRFGIFGFLDVVGVHQDRMTKRYLKQLWQTVLVILAWPRVLGFLLGSLVLFQSMTHFLIMQQVGVWIFILMVLVGSISNTLQYFRNKKILGKETTVLMKSPVQGLFWFDYFFVQIIIRPHFWNAENLFSEWSPLLWTLLIAGSFLFFTANYLIQVKSKDLLMELKSQLA